MALLVEIRDITATTGLGFAEHPKAASLMLSGHKIRAVIDCGAHRVIELGPDTTITTRMSLEDVCLAYRQSTSYQQSKKKTAPAPAPAPAAPIPKPPQTATTARPQRGKRPPGQPAIRTSTTGGKIGSSGRMWP